ncbi:MAG: hypothetical protein ACHQDC_06070 [Acidimicrobiales bacterium]
MTVDDRDLIPFDTWDPPTIDVGPSALPPGVTGCEVRWVHRGGRPVVVKRATGRARAQLRREATILSMLSGSGTVQVEGVIESSDHTELVLADAGRRTLADPGALSATVLRRVLLATCRAVSDLHRRGWSHGAISPDHVVISGRGRVALCSLGRSSRLADDPQAAARDLRDLVATVELSVARPTDASGWRERRRWNRSRRRIRRICAQAVPVDARTLSDRLTTVIDGPRRPMMRWIGAAGAILAGGALTSIVAFAVRRDRPGPHEERSAQPLCVDITRARPDVDGDGCGEPVTIHGPLVDVDGVTYRVGRDDDLVALGDWDCDGTATPTVLRPSSGEVLRYSRWARGGETLPADPLAVIDGARNLTVAPGRTTGCDDLVVGLSDGSSRRFSSDD